MKAITLFAMSILALCSPAFAQSNRTYLQNLLVENQQFASAYKAVTFGLPNWVGSGGVQSPIESVHVGDGTYLLSSACKPHDCPDERLIVLYGPETHQMWGVFQREIATPGSTTPKATEFLWLGNPDTLMRRMLLEQVAKSYY